MFVAKISLALLASEAAHSGQSEGVEAFDQHPAFPQLVEDVESL